MNKQNMKETPGHHHQQHVEGPATNSSNQADEEDESDHRTPTIATCSIPQQHYAFLMEQQKTMKQLQQTQGSSSVDQADNVTISNQDKALMMTRTRTMYKSGAFAVPKTSVENHQLMFHPYQGNTEARSVVTRTQDSTVFPVLQARVDGRGDPFIVSGPDH
jgi:hypothetical protein